MMRGNSVVRQQSILFLMVMFIVWGLVVQTLDLNAANVNASGKITIPKEAVRLRILASSDSSYDQAVKYAVRDAVKDQIDTWVKDLTSFKEAKARIEKGIPELEKIVENVLHRANYKKGYTIALNKAQFPTKMYGKYVYPAGEYDALVVTLGEGDGANWWCVLYPPLCFMDLSGNTPVVKEEPVQKESENPAMKKVEEKEVKVKEVKAEQPEKEKVEYRSLAADVFSGFFGWFQ
ncbi:MAG: stage II sporulation protein R [Bacilli bacterium]